MSIISLNVQSQGSEYNLELHRRISFIRGDSGAGKTSLVRLLALAVNKAPSVQVSLSGVASFRIIASTEDFCVTVKSLHDCLVILDDLRIKDFSCAEDQNLWFLILGREEISGLDCMEYCMIYENGVYTLKPLESIK